MLFLIANAQDQTDFLLANGGKVSIIQSPGDQSWGIMVTSPGLATLEQSYPIQIEYYAAEADIRSLQAGYKTIVKTTTGFTGKGALSIPEGATF